MPATMSSTGACGCVGWAPPEAADAHGWRYAQDAADCAWHRRARRGQPLTAPNAQAPGALAVVAWDRETRPRRALACLRPALRPGAHPALPQAEPRLDLTASVVP